MILYIIVEETGGEIMAHIYYAECGALAQRLLGKGQCARVIAVHSESVYLRAENGRLLLLCSDRYGSVPFGISVEGYRSLREEHAFSEGESVFVNDGALVFSDGTEIKTAASAARTVETERVTVMPSSDILSFCAEYIKEHASERGIGPALPAFLCIGTPLVHANVYALSAAAEADRIESALSERDVSALTDVLSKYIGLGYGLTPSGDDFVCGMAYAFHRYCRVSAVSAEFRDMLAASVGSLLDRTNEISAEYIRCALDGEYFEVVERVLDCMCGNDASASCLEEALGALLSVGASSGSDILCGMLFASYVLL